MLKEPLQSKDYRELKLLVPKRWVTFLYLCPVCESYPGARFKTEGIFFTITCEKCGFSQTTKGKAVYV
jgi:translation initiation factor 2 beta subunit (eIF-2beta)/eIF-5